VKLHLRVLQSKLMHSEPSGAVEKIGKGCNWAFDQWAVRWFVALVAGALIGIAASFTVNCTLVEISMNPYFAVYFGLLFILIACIILWRVKNGEHPRPGLLTTFAILVLFSGLMCFVLENRWFVQMRPGYKVPLYSMLGVSVCFALLFSVIDLINYCSGVCCQSPNSRPIVETETQVYLVVGTAVLMGFVFGLVFGLLDVEDEQISHLRMALLREESICYPIGAAVGGIATVINQWLREKNQETLAFNPLHDEDLDEDF